MNNRPKKNLTDYMVIGISPALIMLMVGSLLFYLLTVFYHGQYQGRMSFIFAMFVMAIVLIARISMEEGIEYATLFAIPLAVVTVVAMVRFVEIQGPLASYSFFINVALIALIWWSSHKLTWDCTLIDDDEDASGEGLLQGLGFDGETVEHQAAEDAVRGASDSSQPIPEPDRKKRRNTDRPLWWQRIVDKRHRPHTPGVWVIYYALAALPLFALGQWLIPTHFSGARMSAFRQLVVYIGSALALLLTTSFLGLRRYLRQRKLEMPTDMAGVWLGTGAIMILVILGFCVFLPRPGAAIKVSQLPFSFGSPDHNRTHEQAVGNDGPERPQQATRTRQDATQSGRNAPTQQGAKRPPAGTSQSQAESKSGNSQSSRSPSRESPSKRSQSGSQSQSSKAQQNQRSAQSQSGNQKTRTSSGGQEQQGTEQSPNNSPAKNGANGSRANQPDSQQRPRSQSSQGDSKGQGNRKRPNDSNRSGNRQDGDPSQQSKPQAAQQDQQPQDARQQPNGSAREKPPTKNSSGGRRLGKDRQREQQNSPRQPQDADRRDGADNKTSNPPSAGGLLSRMASGLGTLVKLLFWAALIGLLAYLAWKHWARVLAAIQQLINDLKNLLAGLFGGRRDVDDADEEAGATEHASRKPFASFSDPFAGGAADRYSTEQLVRHTFEALEAWGRERGSPRGDDQTPLEFARLLAVDHPNIAVEAQQLADLYSRVAYGHEHVDSSRREVLEQLWRHMRSTATMPIPPPAPQLEA